MEKGYIGKIPSSGNMDVKAPNQVKVPKKGTAVTRVRTFAPARKESEEENMDFTENELMDYLGVKAPEEEAPEMPDGQSAGEQPAGTEAQETGESAETTPEEQPGEEPQEEEKPETPEAGQEPSQQPEDAIQAAVNAALAARDAEHRKDLEAVEARQKQQMSDFFRTAQLTNTITGKPITSMEEFDAWKRDFQAQKLQQSLREGKLTREDLDSAISENPAVKAAQDFARQQREAQRSAAQAEEQAAFQARVAQEIAEIGKLEPSVKSVEDLMRLPNAKQFYEYVKRGNSFLDAYYLANREELSRRQQEASRKAAQAAALNVRSKDHLRPTGSSGTGAAAVPRDVMELYREMMPKASEAEIAAHYNKMLAENKRGA